MTTNEAQKTGEIIDPENMNSLDRAVRIALGVGLFIPLHADFPGVMESYIMILPLLSIYPLLTGMLAWDPIYELLKIRTRSVQASDDIQFIDLPHDKPPENTPEFEGARKAA